VNFAADPAANFGGIMRSLNSTNFEQGNVDYSILGDGSLYWKGAITQNNSGKLYFNLGRYLKMFKRWKKTVRKWTWTRSNIG
jgi:hypothetical protein